jgi:transcriptional regulator PpsR
VQVFKSPRESLGDLSAQSAAKLIAAATDVALMVDAQGFIRDVAFNKEELSLELDGHGRWLGSKFSELVTVETRDKVKEMLQAAVSKASSPWRQVNHPSQGGEDIPVLYCAINIGLADRVVVVGRDLRPLASMQQRLINAQQALERDYGKLRNAETRYRLLFQVSAEAVMIVDTTSQIISDANPAALALLDESLPKVLKSQFAVHFEKNDAEAIQNLFGDVRATGRDGAVRLRTAKSERDCNVAVSQFRQENSSFFLVRLSARSAGSENSDLKATSALVQLFEASPDGMVITQHDGRIVKANASFLEMVQLTAEEQARGEILDRWLGRTGVDFGIALANLRQSGSIRLFSTVLRGDLGATSDVEFSAVALAGGDDKSHFGFSVRNIDTRLSSAGSSGRELPRSVAQLTEMIGRVPLKDLVREATDVIEKLSIEAALELTGDNRASAADMLGLSRQSLYVKLRRFGLADSAPDEEIGDE